jgi:hypothetical protein
MASSTSKQIEKSPTNQHSFVFCALRYLTVKTVKCKSFTQFPITIMRGMKGPPVCLPDLNKVKDSLTNAKESLEQSSATKQFQGQDRGLAWHQSKESFPPTR